MKLLEKHFWLGFNLFHGIGPVRFYELLKTFGSAKQSWFASKDQLYQTSIPHSVIDHFLIFREKVNLNEELLRLEKRLIDFVILEDKNYPFNLRSITNPPPVLYLKGQILPCDNLALAVVGTRQITAYGREVTEKFVMELVNRGITIISGLARGVDSIAHRVALGNFGRTTAVLGNGLDKIYPPEHKALADQIISTHSGALVSQLPLGVQPLKGNFPSRNRIISGLSLGTLVTEGASISGAKITCEQAQKQGRPVFAVPGPITSFLSEGPADLIKSGAKLVTKAEDILNELQVERSRAKVERSRKENKTTFKNSHEEKIWQQLSQGGKHIDTLIRETGLPSSQVLSCLTSMELAGMVKNIGCGNYIII